MYVSFNWLKEYLENNDLDPKEVALQLALKGANVEGIEEKGDDYIFDVENKSITHRADLFCHYGLAREVAAIYSLDLKNIQDTSDKKDTKSKEQVNVEIEETDLCNRYIGVLIEGIKVQESPDWLIKKLESIGEKSINNIVDLTNFVMFEVGQPMHAFDQLKVVSHQSLININIRLAKKGEKLVSLDDRELELGEEDLVIADKEKAIALAGVKGGKSTEVDENTSSIILESANFDGPYVRKASIRNSLRTEASSRFEKRLDPNLCKIATGRFIELLPKIGCEEAEVVSHDDSYPNPRKSWNVKVNLVRLPIFAGDEIPYDKIKEILEALEIEILNSSEKEIELKIPTWRNDLHIEEDIYEEIMRVYGFENIKPKPPEGPIEPPKWPELMDYITNLQDHLITQGYDELWLHTFTNANDIKAAGLDESDHIRVKNALSKEVEYLRTSLVPEMVKKVRLNAGNYNAFKLFAIDKVYKTGDNSKKQESYSNITETRDICFADFTKDKNETLLSNQLTMLKNDIKQILIRFSNDISFSPSKNIPVYLNAVKSMEVKLDNKRIGFLGEVNESTKSNFKISGNLYLVNLDLSAIDKYRTENKETNIIFKPINRYPVIKRDLSFWIDNAYHWSEIKDKIASTNSEILQNIELFDIFHDTKKDIGQKSIALSLILQANNKTLTDKEADELVENVINKLQKEFKIKLRDK